MKNFDIKSLILGIGIGIVLTSIIGLIFSLGYTAGTPVNNMTKDQIIAEAKKYGMIENKSIFDDSTDNTNKSGDENEPVNNNKAGEK